VVGSFRAFDIVGYCGLAVAVAAALKVALEYKSYLDAIPCQWVYRRGGNRRFTKSIGKHAALLWPVLAGDNSKSSLSGRAETDFSGAIKKTFRTL